MRWRWLTLGVGLLLLAWVLSQVSLRQLITVLRQADASTLAAALGLGMLATALRGLRYALFFPGHSRLSLYGAFALMRLLTLAMPLRTGEVAFLSLLKKHRLAPSIAEALPVWLVLRLSDVLALALWLLALSSYVTLPTAWLGARWAFGVLAVVLTLAAVAVAAVAARYRTEDTTSWIGSRLEAFRTGWRRVSRPSRVVLVMLPAVAVTGAMIGMTTLAQQAFASPLPWPSTVLLSVLLLAVAMLPVHGPLGLGTFEASWVGLMVLYQVPVPQAASIALGIRLFSLMLVLIDGVLGSTLLMIPVKEPSGPTSRRG